MADRGKETPGELLSGPVLGRLLVVLLFVPALVLAIVYATSVVTGVLFGNVLFALSVLVVGGWMFAATAGWGERMGSVRPANALLVSADEHYARAFSARTVRVASDPVPLLVSLTVAVVLGWVGLLLVSL